MTRRVTRSREKSGRGQLPNLMCAFLTIVHHTPLVPSERELQPSTELSVGARDTVSLTIPSTTTDSPNSDLASRIGVDTVWNHFPYAPADACTHHVPGCGTFGTDRRPLVLFPQDFILVHLLDQRMDYQAGPQVPLHSRATRRQRPLLGRMGEVLLQPYLAPRSRSGEPARGAPAGKRRQGSPTWEKPFGDDTQDNVIRDEEFCVESSDDDSGIPTSGAAVLETMEPQAELSLPKPSVRRRLGEELEISHQEPSAPDSALAQPPAMVFKPSAGDGNITGSLKERSPLSVTLYRCQNFKRIAGNSAVNNLSVTLYPCRNFKRIASNSEGTITT